MFKFKSLEKISWNLICVRFFLERSDFHCYIFALRRAKHSRNLIPTSRNHIVSGTEAPTAVVISVGCCHKRKPRKEFSGGSEHESTKEGEMRRGRRGVQDARERDGGQPLAVCPSARLYITCKRLGVLAYLYLSSGCPCQLYRDERLLRALVSTVPTGPLPTWDSPWFLCTRSRWTGQIRDRQSRFGETR